MKRSRRTS